jgi:hypothetical protein
LRYNRLRWLQPRLLGATFRNLTRESRAAVAGDPPDLIISTGHRSVPVVQAIRRRSGGRTRSVHLGYPRLSPARFDLVVPTPEYPVPDDPNVLRIPYALSRTPAQVEKLDATFLEGLPAPRRLLILGGPTLYWKLDEKEVLQALSRLTDDAADRGGSVMVVGSPRRASDLCRTACVSGLDLCYCRQRGNGLGRHSHRQAGWSLAHPPEPVWASLYGPGSPAAARQKALSARLTVLLGSARGGGSGRNSRATARAPSAGSGLNGRRTCEGIAARRLIAATKIDAEVDCP